MWRDGERRADLIGDEHDEPVSAIGPPGWDDYVAARRRFTVTLAIQGLERALAEPDRRPLRGPRAPGQPSG